MRLSIIIKFLTMAFFYIDSVCIGFDSKDEKDKKMIFSKSETFIESIKGTYKPKKFEGVLEPIQLPDLIKNRKSLVGIDLNKDGVRDDLEVFINRYFEQDYDREIYKKFFRRGTHFFKYASKMNTQQLQEEMDGFSQDEECSRYLAAFGYLKNLNEFRVRRLTPWELLFNTPMRDNFLGLQQKRLRSWGSGINNGQEAFKYCSSYVQQKYPMKK